MGQFERMLVLSTSTVTSKAAIHHSVTLAKTLNTKLYVYHSDYDPFNIEFWNLPIPSLEDLRKATDNHTGKRDKYSTTSLRKREHLTYRYK